MSVSKSTGSTSGNTNLIFLFLVFTFATMFITPVVYILRLQYMGVAAIIGIMIMAMIGTGLVFFITKRQEEARIITIAAVILVEIVFVVFFIMLIASYVSS